MIYLLVIILGFLTYFIYYIYKDVLNPAFVFSAVFLVASINLMTNIDTVGVNIHLDTILCILFGILALFVGTILINKVNIRVRSTFFDTISVIKKKRRVQLNNCFLFLTLIFNIFSIFYILKEVYSLTIQYAYYSGSVLGSLSVFAEVSKFGNIGLRVGTLSTFLSAFLEAEAFVLGYIIISSFVDKTKNNILVILCFITSFLSTFCQGSRGGIFIIITLLVIYVLLDRINRNKKHINMKLIRKGFLAVLIALVVFQITGVATGKNWDISAYEYLSVYLGFPIYNFDRALLNGIPRTKPIGLASFPGLYSNLFPKLGIDFEKYTYLSNFLSLNGHNTGNVYTIFGSLIADFGFIGATFVLMVIGSIMQLLYNKSKRNEYAISMAQILYAYFLSCIAFSFFSNKICENITMYHIFEFIFACLWSMLLTRKSRKRRVKRTNIYYEYNR